MNGIDEALRYNGILLDDGINVAGSDPAGAAVRRHHQYAGHRDQLRHRRRPVRHQRRCSRPGRPAARLPTRPARTSCCSWRRSSAPRPIRPWICRVTMSHTGTFVSGGTGTYTITVSNAGRHGARRQHRHGDRHAARGPDLSTPSSGTGWTCGAAGQVVTCTHAPTLNPGASLPPLTLMVNVLEAAAASVTNSVTVSSPSYELITANNTATDVTATLDPNLSTSTKSVVDMNGGEASPGDTLRYTITLTETAGGQARNVSLTDDVPDDVTFGGFVSVPAGATSSFTAAPAGANGNGIVNVSAHQRAGEQLGHRGVRCDRGRRHAARHQHRQHGRAQQSERAGEQSGRARGRGQSVADPECRARSSSTCTARRPVHARCRASCPPRRTPTSRWPTARRTPGPSRRRCRRRSRISANPIPVRLWLTRSGNNPGARSVTVTLTASNRLHAPRSPTASRRRTRPPRRRCSASPAQHAGAQLPGGHHVHAHGDATRAATTSRSGRTATARRATTRASNSRRPPSSTSTACHLQRRVQRRRGAEHVLSGRQRVRARADQRSVRQLRHRQRAHHHHRSGATSRR